MFNPTSRKNDCEILEFFLFPCPFSMKIKIILGVEEVAQW
jgi:hypothetical protein